jgi:hypothetical protein
MNAATRPRDEARGDSLDQRSDPTNDHMLRAAETGDAVSVAALVDAACRHYVERIGCPRVRGIPG